MRVIRLTLIIAILLPNLGHSHFLEEKLGSVLVLLAHPDDETWCSGTLAKLAKHGTKVRVIYATSGGRGKDRSGRNLSGQLLAKEREQESIRALNELGIPLPPVFLRIQDRELSEDAETFKSAVIERIIIDKPNAIFTFHGSGITGHKDHRFVSDIARDISQNHYPNTPLFLFAVSKTRADALALLSQQFENPYRVKFPVDDIEISFSEDVSLEKMQRIKAFSQYRTQFPESLQTLWQAFVGESFHEDWIRVR